MPRVTLVLTVKNEQSSLPHLFDSLERQTRRPDQIICVDGGSTDETVALLTSYTSAFPLLVISCPGANIAQGRNAAIQRAETELIAVTDAGVRLDSYWLEALCAPFEGSDPPDVAAGFFLPDPHTTFELALAATTLPAMQDIQAESFLPSSRSVAFSKRAWQKAGGYPEWLDYCEDLVFDLALRRAACRIRFVPEACVQFRPRPTLRSFFRQYFLYARGDGKANLWPRRHLVRYVTYLVLAPMVAAGLGQGKMLVAGGALAAGLALMFYTPYRRLASLARGRSPRAVVAAAFWVPLVRVTGDLAKMLGYPIGLVWRWQRASPLTNTREPAK